jgi:putative FmdB family regulatory protein
MPTYEYKCRACGKSMEIFHSMTEVKRKCPACGKSALERQIGTGGAVIFKGSGFYQTDYRSESYKKKADAEGGAAAGKGGGEADGKAGGSEKAAKPASESTRGASPNVDGKGGGSREAGSKAAPESRSSKKAAD